jgi:glycosyltransferase involved in cell wall biosynthesis
MQRYNLVPVVLTMNDEFWLPYTLECLAGHFGRYVIYDVGSTDRTKDIIDWFVQKEKKRADFFIRYLPFVPPVVQGTFRNSMIAESESDWYFIVDADELYKPEALRNIVKSTQGRDDSVPYGVVNRFEVVEGLTEAYGTAAWLSHHRVYHRDMYWTGTHPGEVAAFTQKESREFTITDATCYHFHNTNRSSKDSEVPKRIERRKQATYHRGELAPLEVVKELPILLKRFEDFPVNPSLKLIHDTM